MFNPHCRFCAETDCHVRLRRFFIYIVGVVASSVAPERCAAQPSEMLKERFAAEAPEKWKEYRRFAARLQGTVSRVFEVFHEVAQAKGPAKVPAPINSEIKIKRNVDSALAITHVVGDGDPYSYVLGWNPKYALHLHKSGKSDDWVLASYISGNREKAVFEGDRYEQIVDFWSSYLLIVDYRPIEELIRRKDFHVVSIKEVTRAGRTLAEVRFRCPHDVKESPFFPVQSGVLVLDPDLYWCLREYHLDMKYRRGESTFTATNDIVDFNGYPIPSRGTQSSSEAPTGAPIRKVTFQFDLKDPGNLPGDHEFTLSAFGLPEPVGVAWATPTRWNRWFIGAALAAGALSIVLYRRRSKARISD